MNLIDPRQRDYLRAHPWVLWGLIGLTVAGLLQIVALIVPEAFPNASTVVGLPPWLHTIYAALWTLAAFAALYGMFRGKPKHEAGGMAMLAAVLFAWAVTSLYVVGTSAIPGTSFVISLGIGSAQRSWFLSTLNRYR